MRLKGAPESRPATADAPAVPATTGGQDVLVVFATSVGMAGLNLLVQAMLAYTLLPEGRGAYAVCMVFGALLALVFTPGAAQGTQYFVAARQMSVSQGVSAMLIISLAGGGLAAALAVPLLYGDLAYFQKAETHTFLLSLVLVPAGAVSFGVHQQLIALRRFRRLAVFSLLRVAANVLGALVLVWRLGFGVEGAIIAFAVGHCVMTATGLADLRRHCGLALALPTRSNLARILGYGLKHHVAWIGTVMELQIGILMMGMLASRADIGLFSAASTLMVGFALLSNAVGTALFPRVAGRECGELVALCLRLVGVATAAALLPFLILSAPLVRLLLSEAFLPAVPLLWIIAPGILALALSGILMTHFKGVNRPEVCSWAVLLGLCVNLGALLLLYPKLGVAAAAWSMTIGMLCRCCFLAIVFHRATQMAWLATWLPRRSDVSFLWAAGRSVLARSTPPSFPPHHRHSRENGNPAPESASTVVESSTLRSMDSRRRGNDEE